MQQDTILFVGANPNFLGGISTYQKNLIKYILKFHPEKKIFWVYPGKENRNYSYDKINYKEVKTIFRGLLGDLEFNLKIPKTLKKEEVERINSHAIWGYWNRFFSRQKDQRIAHTYHGVTYEFFKNHLDRFGIFKKIIFTPVLFFSYFIEKPPMKKADKIICVSGKVKKQLERLYGKRKEMIVIRTGVDLKNYKTRDKMKSREKIGLEKKKVYGLYVGRGGYWTKGLDDVVEFSKKIHNLNSNYRLIVVGADYSKNKHLLEEDFIIYKEKVERNQMPFYYNSSDVFFCFSRYEGGAPTLVVSEAMASGCLVVCAERAEQEIIKDEKNGLIIKNFDRNDASKVLKNMNNKKIILEAQKTIKGISLEKWGQKYLEVLLN